jgi:hypothetical protein
MKDRADSMGQGPESSQGMPQWFREARDRAFPPEEAEAMRLERITAQNAKAYESAARAAEANLKAEQLRANRFGGYKPAGASMIHGDLTLLTDNGLPSLDSHRWRVKSVIPDTGFGAIYGDSGTFKSFVAVDLLAAIANGIPFWFGRRVAQAPCVYVPFEGRGGIPKRVEAWRLAMALRHTPTGMIANGNEFSTGIHFVMEPLNLRNENDRKKLVNTLKAAGLTGCVLCIDTLAQAGGGIDENSSEGMGEMIRIFRELHDQLGGVVLVVHHSGKQASAGLRGHSSLRAALDFAIECYKPEGDKYAATMRLDKVKDDEDGKEFPFRMRRVGVGYDDDGDHITSLVVEPPSENMPEVTRRAPGGDVQQAADDDWFIYGWVKQKVETGSFPSSSSLQADLAEMKARRVMTQKRVRDAISRLKAASLLKTSEFKSPSGNAWLRYVDAPSAMTTP